MVLILDSFAQKEQDLCDAGVHGDFSAHSSLVSSKHPLHNIAEGLMSQKATRTKNKTKQQQFTL